MVLAGGGGTRLWPLSRTTYPKHLLSLGEGPSLLQDTLHRLLPIFSVDSIWVVAHQDQRVLVEDSLRAVSPSLCQNLLVEPIARNTLPAIAWAVARIKAHSPHAVVGVFPSDHTVRDEAAFQAAWNAAERLAEDRVIALFGIHPDRPATDYGYIEAGEPIGRSDGVMAYRTQRFVEKPNGETAASYLKQGGYYWNSGMFGFRVDVFQDLLARFAPEVSEVAKKLATAASAPRALYESLPDLSIDYGLMEKAEHAAVIPVSMGWSDLGTWEALYTTKEKDPAHNVVVGNGVAVRSAGNLLWSEPGHLLAVLGISDLAVIQTADTTVVVPRSEAHALKELVAEVKKREPTALISHPFVKKPWGSYQVLTQAPGYQVKTLIVAPGAKLSMQLHKRRAEHWVVATGEALITVGEAVKACKAGEHVSIPVKTRHRLENNGTTPLVVIETQIGEYLGEDDIVRFDDLYGRV